jgi:hypothetical protein
MYSYTGPPILSEPRPWAYHVVGKLFGAHLLISVVASVAVVVLTRGHYRWLAWAAILAVDVFAAFLWLDAAMMTTNCWL